MILSGRKPAHPSEDVLLRARLDLEEGRTRQAALQARAAHAALGAELRGERGADQVAAMDDGLRTLGRRVVYGALERVGAIVAVRDDANLHAADRRIAACIASRAVDL